MTGLASDPGPATHAAVEGRKPRLPWRELGPRLGSAVVMMTAALATTFWGGVPFAIFWFLASLLILREWQALIGSPKGVLPLALGGVALAASAILTGTQHVAGGAASLALGAIALSGVAPAAGRRLAAAGVAYAGIPLLCLILLRNSSPFGMALILWLFAIVWGTDIMAFFGGRLVGGPKLAPRFSPSKTWAGFLIGIVSGSLIGLAVAPASADKGRLMLLGLVAGIVAQGGDLFESALKRHFGVKDSSRLIPGHGGVMDRLDGFAAAACFAALIGIGRAGVGAPGLGLFSW